MSEKKNFPLPKVFSSCKLEELVICFINALYPKVTTKLLLVDILSHIPMEELKDFPWSVAGIEQIFKNLQKKSCVGKDFKPSLADGHNLICHFIQRKIGQQIVVFLPGRLRAAKSGVFLGDIVLTSARIGFYLNEYPLLEPTLDKVDNKVAIFPYYVENKADLFFQQLDNDIQVYMTGCLIENAINTPVDELKTHYLSDFVEIGMTKEKYTTTFFYYFLYIKYDMKKFEKAIDGIYHNQAFFTFYHLVKAFLEEAENQEDCLHLSRRFKEVLKAMRKSIENPHYSFSLPFAHIYLFCMIKAYNNLDAKEEIRKDYAAFLKSSNLPILDREIFEHFLHNTLSERAVLLYLDKIANIHNRAPLLIIPYILAVYNLPQTLERDRLLIQVLNKYYKVSQDKLMYPSLIFAQVYAALIPQLGKYSSAELKTLEDFVVPQPKKAKIFDFTSLKEKEVSWEKQIDAIYNFMTQENKKEAKKKAKSPKRLIWLVSYDFSEVNPYEQSFTKNDWTKGRKVSVTKLRDDTSSYPHLTEQDIDIIKHCTKKYWDGTYSIDYAKALPLLVNHPLVFDSRTLNKTEIVLKEAELKIDFIKSKKEEEYLLSFDLPARYPSIHVKKRDEKDEHKLYVTPITPAHIQLSELMGNQKELRVPQDAQEKILQLLSSEKSPVKVQMNAKMLEVSQEKINTEITLRLKRFHTKENIGLEVQAIIYPLEGHTTCFTPTKGAEFFVAKVENSPAKILRNLAKEKEEIDKLLEKCPLLKENLFNENYSWEFSQTEDAYNLLLALQETNIKIEWHNSESIKMSKSLQLSDFKVQVKSKNSWFSLQGDVQVDEKLVLDMRTLLKAVEKNKGRFIPLADGQVLALTEEFRKMLDKVSMLTQDQKNENILHPLAVPALQNIFDEENLQSDKVWKDWQKKLSTLDEDAELPKGLQADLRPYQVEGFNWLASLIRLGAGACLADDMGLGKTLQTIALILYIVQNTKIIKGSSAKKTTKKESSENNKKPILIIAPTSVCHNWESEIQKFAPQLTLKRLTSLNSKKERTSIIENLEENEILIIGYGLLGAEINSLLKRQYKLIVFDEAQALKNAQTLRSKSSVQLEADSKLALTGTPIENSLEDLWSIFNVINNALLGSKDSFNQRFNPPATALDVTKNNARNNLKALVKPFILRRTKTKVLEELPPRIEQTLVIEPSEEERAFYEALRRQALENIEKIRQEKEKQGEKSQSQFHVLAELTKLRRACCNPSLVDEHSTITSSKLTALVRLVEDLRANNHQALIFSQFTSHLKIVHDAIQKENINAFYLDGSTPEKKREELVHSFQNGQADIFCISLKAGGQGLNLTAADYVIHLDPWWNPAVEDQASDRAYRMGQTRPVTIYRLIMQGTVEEKILNLHATKRELADDILSNTNTAHKLTLNDLMELF